MASTVVQMYLKAVLESYFHVEPQVRLHATEVAVMVLRQGLVTIALVSVPCCSMLMPLYCHYTSLLHLFGGAVCKIL